MFFYIFLTFYRAPDWIFEEREATVPHQFQERMLLPAIDPRTRASFRVGIVEQVLNTTHFIVSLLEEPEVRRVLCFSYGLYSHSFNFYY